jgi:hypothetical protein
VFNLIKPGHVLQFGTDPAGIVSPKGVDSNQNDNTLVRAWPTTSQLGLVQCVSHPAGALGAIAADIATRLRTSGNAIARMASYSAIGRAKTPVDRPVGSETCDFVGYVDGQSQFIASARTVFSKDFSGCLMVAYNQGGRRVAHAAASQVAKMDCKQAFLDAIRAQNATLIGWFRPFVDARDGARRMAAFNTVSKYIGGNPYAITTFGVVTAGNQAYSIDAFKPTTIPANNAWVVTDIRAHTLSQSWRFA